MKTSLNNRSLSLENVIYSGKKWFQETPERALERAYRSAVKIRSIETEHFNGKRVPLTIDRSSSNLIDCFQTDVRKELGIIRMKLAEFKTSRLLFPDLKYDFREKVQFIDETIAGYRENENAIVVATVPVSEKPTITIDSRAIEPEKVTPTTRKTGVLPRSIGRTLQKIQGDMNPKQEEEILRQFRNSRRNTRRAIRFMLLLIIIPLLAQKASKDLWILPTVEKYRSNPETPVFINVEMKEEAMKELQAFEEEMNFDRLLHKTPAIEAEEKEKKVAEKVEKIAEKFRHQSNSAISNILADLVGLVAFTTVIFLDRSGVVATKNFLGEVIYGLSDSAKAFILILLTDIFVGFHSPHGWEVVLEGFAGHFGLPANRSAIFLFIATFPVILDTVFKYWIFRYLNQISPSAVATLKNMNE
ncbi:proton extrusion protein PcxA [Pannus brasiliensis CCIBt3594]|uniref:Proton extrusion protein PxcA n=1 Tax=Pannus brasiliensis CCIBt3594 TaxID=1427578 RepID=A0AAW9QVJ6_9CHRO